MAGDLPERSGHKLLTGRAAVPPGFSGNCVGRKISSDRARVLSDGGWHRALGRTFILPGNSLVSGRTGADT